MKNECIPFYRPGQDVTAAADENLTGCRLVAIVGDRTGGPLLGDPSALGDDQNLIVVGTPSAGGVVFGVAGYDVAEGGVVPVKRAGVLPVLTAGALNAGDACKVDATGKILAATAGSVVVGYVLADVGSGDLAQFVLVETGEVATLDILQQSSITSLTDHTTGVASDTLILVRTDTVAHAVADISANEAALAAKVNAILTALDGAGVTA